MHGQMPNQPLDPEALRALLSGSRLPKNVFPGIGVYIPAHPSSQNEPCTYFTQQNRKNGQALSCVFNTTDQLCQSSGENQHKGCRAFPAVSPTLALPWTKLVSQCSDGAQGAHAALTPCEGHREDCPKSALLWEAAFTAPCVDISPARTSVGASTDARDGNTAQSYCETLGEGRGLILESMANTNICWREFSIDSSYSYVHQW